MKGFHQDLILMGGDIKEEDPLVHQIGVQGVTLTEEVEVQKITNLRKISITQDVVMTQEAGEEFQGVEALINEPLL